MESWERAPEEKRQETECQGEAGCVRNFQKEEEAMLKITYRETRS